MADTMRRILRREAPSTVGLLADAKDFAAMRRYRTFTFTDHDVYLQQVEGLLRALTAQGVRTSVALFDPEEYEEFCADTALDPDSPDSRSHFTAEIAARGASVLYTGQPLTSLLPLLIGTAVRQATWEYATMVLVDRGECAECGQDIGRTAFDRASRILVKLLEEAGPGIHHLVCSVPAEDNHLLATLHATSPAPEGPAAFDATHGTEFVTVLAAGIALESPGGVVLRTSGEDVPDRLHGWKLRGGSVIPLTAAEVFNAYCTDAETGEPVSPEPGVDYRAGFDLGPDASAPHH
ncbi:hypothetical protein [Streptomyces sp. NPDC050504]|uniref:hypothetical protein n=1 Tax=Streptomyces sp. NPDC050504 TaxID=3365618 RepID=UPI003793D218